MVTLLLVFTLRLIAREESELVVSQGPSYERYRRAVPRLLPALRARLPASGARPRWGQALLGESFMWAFAASIALRAAGAPWAVTWGAVAMGMVVVFAWRQARRRRPPTG